MCVGGGGGGGGGQSSMVIMAGERCPSPSQLGECCKLPHWGLGLCPRSQRYLHLTTLQNSVQFITNYAFICSIAGVKVGGGGGQLPPLPHLFLCHCTDPCNGSMVEHVYCYLCVTVGAECFIGSHACISGAERMHKPYCILYKKNSG